MRQATIASYNVWKNWRHLSTEIPPSNVSDKFQIIQRAVLYIESNDKLCFLYIGQYLQYVTTRVVFVSPAEAVQNLKDFVVLENAEKSIQ